MSSQLLDSLKKKPKPKEFTSVGIKVASYKTDVVINTKIIDQTSSKLVNRNEILQNLKKGTTTAVEPAKPTKSKKRLKIVKPLVDDVPPALDDDVPSAVADLSLIHI